MFFVSLFSCKSLKIVHRNVIYLPRKDRYLQNETVSKDRCVLVHVQSFTEFIIQSLNNFMLSLNRNTCWPSDIYGYIKSRGNVIFWSCTFKWFFYTENV